MCARSPRRGARSTVNDRASGGTVTGGVHRPTTLFNKMIRSSLRFAQRTLKQHGGAMSHPKFVQRHATLIATKHQLKHQSTMVHPMESKGIPSWTLVLAAFGAAYQWNSTEKEVSKVPIVVGETRWASGLFSTSSSAQPSELDKCVVMISSTHNNGTDVLYGHGSGIVLSSQGHILTNAHCLHPNLSHSVNMMYGKLNTDLHVTVQGKEYPARLLGLDGLTDLAIIKVEFSDFSDPDSIEFTPAIFHSQKDLGDVKCVAATEKGLETANVSHVSTMSGETLGRWEKRANYFVGCSKVVPGFSGGPMISNDQVVGMTTFVDDSHVYAINMTDGTMDLIRALLVSSVAGEGMGGIARPWIGLKVASTNGQATVLKVAPFSPASLSGILPGDVVKKVNGEVVKDCGQVMQRLAVVPKGSLPADTVHLSIQRQGLQLEVDVATKVLESGWAFKQRIRFLA